MITVNGQKIQNTPKEYISLDLLFHGKVESNKLSFLKTTQDVYGNSIEELTKYALTIKEADNEYDTLFVYGKLDYDESDERTLLKVINI